MKTIRFDLDFEITVDLESSVSSKRKKEIQNRIILEVSKFLDMKIPDLGIEYPEILSSNVPPNK
jgi:hypothetical protein